MKETIVAASTTIHRYYLLSELGMTNIKADATITRGANLGFTALLLALFGWANIEVLMLMSNPGIAGELLACAIGLYLSVFACRRYRIWWVPMVRSLPENRVRNHAGASRLGSGFMLAALGCAMAYVMRTGSVITPIIAAGVVMFIPWSRSRFCRLYFFLSQGLLVVGGLPVLIIAAKNQHPIILLIDTWVLWSLAAGLLLVTLWLQRSAAVAADKSQVGR